MFVTLKLNNSTDLIAFNVNHIVEFYRWKNMDSTVVVTTAAKKAGGNETWHIQETPEEIRARIAAA